MTIQELHQNEALRRREFPVCGQKVFLAHAGVSPVPARVASAISRYAEACAQGDQEKMFPKGLTLEIRGLAAKLLQRSPNEIALVGPTTAAISMIANGLDWRKGDNVVFSPDDYPSNALPWMNLARHKVELREVQPGRLGFITVDEIRPLLDRRTRLVALASAHFISGCRIALDFIGDLVRSRGALFCVDGIQTLGACSTPAQNADFLAADSHKWLLGPCAAGILFVRQESMEKLHPTILGADNVICKNYITPRSIVFREGASRYEGGSPNLLGLVGLHESLKLLMEFGPAEIERTVQKHTRHLRQELRKRGCLLIAESDDMISGITSFRLKNGGMEALHQKLNKANIITSLRQTRDGNFWIRVSPHFYNTREELDRFLDVLGK